MKFFAALTLALATLVSAAVNNFDAGLVGVRLNLVNASFGPSKGLFYKGMGK
jgi:hypothetical protein